MVLVALGLTILGFVLLIAAVASGQIMWAWACIAVSALGLVVLVIDLIRGHGNSSEGREDGSGGAQDDVVDEGVHLGEATSDSAAP